MRPIEHLTPTEKDWVTNKASLTVRLRQFTHNEITLQLFHDDWGPADEASRTALKITGDEKTWIRHIEWHYRNIPWLSCDVVIPKRSITPETIELTLIGNGSIGDTLFKDKTLQRSDFVFFKANENTVTRHSVLLYKEHPLLVVETFLPVFFEAIRAAECNRPSSKL
ncbi:MAG: hypothetical protein A3F13_02925 [Gammaproteobacteria bacterium RIFCSPHIGHO2_12_FULL_40_19]|nr:MAG: hypothetical protein A3F13_02925 [Gammaproteobacteria bacterium RIFCSPHIGHO2_12_FULL_40_19]